ncbi:Membrane protein CcdC involved in cytochrome C biogenesis [Paenibacillus sp. UNC496MF]|uniref:cytochrome c biogenesis protein CcdC n=1 Tax=Paenibacillus sp. UNC496MF TaxID=1502753 RepID=UPI0008E1C514|nr:cytochrome c biogenesis protein CcdC [Paenibacillus sp. UNC496MF]SFJ22508.1 Membrane protein CcdC involved in cytochrome C biogenesis [Paenibacillus sp. UNC496MF]
MQGSSFYLVVVLIAALILWRRTRAMYRPIKGSGIRLLLPAVYVAVLCVPLASGPNVDAPPWEFLVAFLVGAVLSVPLIWTTNYELRADGQIYAVKNSGFIVAFLAVFVIRFLLRNYFAFIGPETEAALFVVVAAGYAVPWRIVSYAKFRRLLGQRAAAMSAPGAPAGPQAGPQAGFADGGPQTVA